MQELRFVGVEQGAVIATNHDGERFRLVIDDALRNVLRPRPVSPRSSSAAVPPRVIQQLIRAGHTVDEVVAETGADPEVVERFEGPIITERRYMVEQARAVAVRVSQPIDPLAGEGATFGTTIDDRLEQLEAQDIQWDAWKDQEAGWRIGLDFTAAEVTRNALWAFDPKTHTLEALSPTAVTLSQQTAPPQPTGPHLRAVDHHATDQVIPLPNADAEDSAQTTGQHRNTQYDTADLLDALRRRRGERSSSPYDEEAEYVDDEFDESFEAELAAQEAETTRVNAPVTHLHGDPATASRSVDIPLAVFDETTAADKASGADETQPDHDADTATATASEGDASGSADKATSESESMPQPDSQSQEQTAEPAPTPPRRNDTGSLGRRGRSGRPAMPSWDEIVFGTRSDD